jgi:hypothetical protein
MSFSINLVTLLVSALYDAASFVLHQDQSDNIQVRSTTKANHNVCFILKSTFLFGIVLKGWDKHAEGRTLCCKQCTRRWQAVLYSQLRMQQEAFDEIFKFSIEEI